VLQEADDPFLGDLREEYRMSASSMKFTPEVKGLPGLDPDPPHPRDDWLVGDVRRVGVREVLDRAAERASSHRHQPDVPPVPVSPSMGDGSLSRNSSKTLTRNSDAPGRWGT
jgi:hypothetical protein